MTPAITVDEPEGKKLKQLTKSPQRKRQTLVLLVIATVMSFGALIGARKAYYASDYLGVAFGPTIIGPSDIQGSQTTQVLIGLLLPAVQKATPTPFKLQVISSKAEIVIPVPAKEVRRSAPFAVRIFFDKAKQAHFLQVKNVLTGQIQTVRTIGNDLTIRCLPAIQDDGLRLPPVAASATLVGTNDAVFGDGSVVPIPFQTPLPASLVELDGL